MTEKKVKNDWIMADKKRALFWVSVEEYLGHLDDSHAAAHTACAVDSMKDFEGSLDDAIALIVDFAAADAEHRKQAALAGIETLSVTYERKFNLGDYNSLHIGMTAWADVHDDTTAEKVQAELWEWVKEAVKAQALPVIDAAKQPTSQTKAPTTIKPPAPARSAPPPAPGSGERMLPTPPGHPHHLAGRDVPSPPPATPPIPPSQVKAAAIANGLAQGSIIQTEFIRIVAPKGKPIVEFWRPNRKYAEIRWSLGGEKLLAIAPELFQAGWRAAHFNAEAVGQEYQLPVSVHWEPSKPDGKYKDITLVTTR